MFQCRKRTPFLLKKTSLLLNSVEVNFKSDYLPLENITDLKSTCRLLRARLRAREREFATEQARRGPFSQAVKAELNRRQELVCEVTHGLQRSRDQEIDLEP